MSDHTIELDHQFDLAGRICDEDASQEDFVELASALVVDQAVRRRYMRYCRMHSVLRLELRADRAAQAAYQQIGITPNAVKIEVPVSPAPTFPASLWHGTTGWFSSGWPVAYLVATLIFGIGLLVGSHTYVSQPEQVARRSSVPSRVVPEPKTELVGKITGMVDCQWAGVASDSPGVPLGRKYELASGLVEITYDTGARVILQGPVAYEVESRHGGYLAVGKLTGKVEAETAKGFTIHTPTATVTDLGTEFGVEVDKQGSTTSHVFCGLVKVQAFSGREKPEGVAQVLRENQSARVENTTGKQGGGNRIVVVSVSAKLAEFVRQIPKQTITVLDLVDVVAGGDGFSGRRNRGINPTTGGVATSLRCAGPTPMAGDGHYHRVTSMPFVDGVSIPDGRAGPVQVDSAGHVFDGFLATANLAWNPIWAGGPLETPTKLGEVDYALPPHGLLFLASNNAITFDLEAIRRANRGLKLLRFRAVAANTVTPGFEGCDLADIRVLIDGQSWFQRRQIRNEHGVFSVLVPIHDHDRFLTLASTDGGDGISGDWITYGDPRLELLPSGAAPDPQEKTRGKPLPQQGIR